MASLEDAWQALDEGDPHLALRTLLALRRAGVDAPEAGALEALAQLELGNPEAARAAVAAAELRLPPGHPDLLWAAGQVHLAYWSLEEAEEALEALVEAEPEFAAAYGHLALLADLGGRMEEADQFQAVAHGLDPEFFPPPRHLDERAFEGVVAQVAAELPAPFRGALEHLPVVIDPVPSWELASRAPLDTPAGALGLFVGASALERSSEGHGGPPAVIFLFQRNLERVSFDQEELEQEIRVTFLHELGHALGFDEEGVEAMGLG